jgi:hypothetical protein
MGFFEQIIINLGSSTWWIFGLALLLAEMLLPGMVLIWFGVAALIVGSVVWFAPLIDWRIQLVAWALLSVALLLIGRRYFRRPQAGEDTLLNDRAARFVGRVFTLAEPIVESSGRLKIDDTVWRVTGPDLPAGTRVAVTGTDGSQLKVERQG